MWESRVLRRAFERLELHEGKLSRAVLRGGGGGDVTSLPDPGWATTPVYPARITRTARRFARTSRFWKPRSNRTERGRSRSLIVALMRVGRGGSQEGSARPCIDGRLSDGRWGPANAATTSGSAPR